MRSAREAVACHLCMDNAEMPEYNYKAGHYSRAVYAVESGYYCASKTGNDLPKPTRKGMDGFVWVEVIDTFVNDYGWKIYKAVE